MSDSDTLLFLAAVGKGQSQNIPWNVGGGPCPPEGRAADGYIFRSHSDRHFNRWYLLPGCPDLQKEMTAGTPARAAIISMQCRG